jgi:hypothetical protein
LPAVKDPAMMEAIRECARARKGNLSTGDLMGIARRFA